jgi:hypothetical protein
MKFSLINNATSELSKDSASSRAQAPQEGAAEKSMSKGFFCSLAAASAWSASFIQFTDIWHPPCLVEYKNNTAAAVLHLANRFADSANKRRIRRSIFRLDLRELNEI